MKTFDERILKVKDYTIKRVYWDVKNNPHSYPTEWIISDGIPYWKWHKKQYKNEEVQIIIDLYKSLLK